MHREGGTGDSLTVGHTVPASSRRHSGSARDPTGHAVTTPPSTTLVLAAYQAWHGLPSHGPAPYSSTNPAIVSNHIRAAKAQGIDGFVVDWCGPPHASITLMVSLTVPESAGCEAWDRAVITAASGLSAAIRSFVVETTTVPCVYLPLVSKMSYTCPSTSVYQYSGGIAYQLDGDNPVRPAYNHADKNLELRGYTPNMDPNLKRELVDYGSGDPTQPPQLATLFEPHRVPALSNFYRVYDWRWTDSPDPGTRGDPITDFPVTALGMRTTPGETLHVPTSGFDIGGGMEVIVLFADEDTVALRYAREDSVAPWGYTVHVDNICTDPNLLALYNSLDDPNGPRYVYVPPEARPYSYDLPNLSAGQPFGTARSTEIIVAIVDSGGFMDTRSCNEWWQMRPGYTGTCPPHEWMHAYGAQRRVR